jgi:acetylornithine deacetylase
VFRTVGSGTAVREAMHVVESLVTVEDVLDIPAVRMHTLPGYDAAVFPYTTDVPLLTRWGTPLLVGPGSIHVAHTEEEHLAIDELVASIHLYESLVRQLI